MIIDELKSVVKKVAPKIDTEKVTEDARLMEDLRLDSLSVLMIAMGVEEKFGVHFENFVPFKTVKEVVDALKEMGIQD
ncbi:MAG: phosphopantetheine-binding protein [Treponema sp.]|nr:phosphopantetheine-binding protein [Treponema sp.]